MGVPVQVRTTSAGEKEDPVMVPGPWETGEVMASLSSDNRMNQTIPD
jgi:hypothetical protein